MIPICTEVENLIHPAELRVDEYREDNGLIYCSKCRTPRQKRIEIMGRTIEPRCLCKCQQAEQEKREQERKHREFLDRVARNRSVGLTDPSLRKHTFENDLGYNPKPMDIAKQYVQHWEEFKKDSTGVLLWGDVGTGKSFIAGCIANALLNKGVPVIMTNFARLLNKLTDMYSGDRNAYIDSFNRYPLMIIDDLGIERNSDFAREQVFSVIDSRYRSQLPMIVTTNLTLEELKDPVDLSRSRIYDRILERCLPIRVNEQNIRDLNQATAFAKKVNPVALEIKSVILKSGYTQSEIVDTMSADFGWSGSPSNFSRKLNEGTLRYEEAMELAQALGYEIRWEKVRGLRD